MSWRRVWSWAHPFVVYFHSIFPVITNNGKENITLSRKGEGEYSLSAAVVISFKGTIFILKPLECGSEHLLSTADNILYPRDVNLGCSKSNK